MSLYMLLHANDKKRNRQAPHPPFMGDMTCILKVNIVWVETKMVSGEQ